MTLEQLQQQVTVLARELGQTRRELFVAKRAIDLIRPHLFTSDEDDLPGGTGAATTIGINTEGSETADSATWAKSLNNGPVAAWITCRVVYNDAGDKKLYEYRRKFTYDGSGLLISISGETRIEVDAPGSCP